MPVGKYTGVGGWGKKMASKLVKLLSRCRRKSDGDEKEWEAKMGDVPY